MKNLLQRIVTGLVFLAVVIGCITWNLYSLASLFYVVGILSLWEFYSMAKMAGYHPQGISGVIAATSLFVIVELVRMGIFPPSAIALVIPLFLIVPIIELYRKAQRPMANVAFTFFGIAYTVLPFIMLNLLALFESEEHFTARVVLGFFIIIWVNDTGAYVFGRLLGKHKLFERISPKKTWEGTIGGAIVSLFAARIIAGFYPCLSLPQWLIIAMIVVIFGSFGDLVESLFKRQVQMKDSGRLLPGHGGVLDRFDAVLLAGPMVFAYLVIFVL